MSPLLASGVIGTPREDLRRSSQTRTSMPRTALVGRAPGRPARPCGGAGARAALALLLALDRRQARELDRRDRAVGVRWAGSAFTGSGRSGGGRGGAAAAAAAARRPPRRAARRARGGRRSTSRSSAMTSWRQTASAHAQPTRLPTRPATRARRTASWVGTPERSERIRTSTKAADRGARADPPDRRAGARVRGPRSRASPVAAPRPWTSSFALAPPAASSRRLEALLRRSSAPRHAQGGPLALAHEPHQALVVLAGDRVDADALLVGLPASRTTRPIAWIGGSRASTCELDPDVDAQRHVPRVLDEDAAAGDVERDGVAADRLVDALDA